VSRTVISCCMTISFLFLFKLLYHPQFVLSIAITISMFPSNTAFPATATICMPYKVRGEEPLI
jgi:hypothetical protein